MKKRLFCAVLAVTMLIVASFSASAESIKITSPSDPIVSGIEDENMRKLITDKLNQGIIFEYGKMTENPDYLITTRGTSVPTKIIDLPHIGTFTEFEFDASRTAPPNIQTGCSDLTPIQRTFVFLYHRVPPVHMKYI